MAADEKNRSRNREPVAILRFEPVRRDSTVSLAVRRDHLMRDHQLNLRRAAVENLQKRLAQVCADIIENGGSAKKICQARVLSFSLLLARRRLKKVQH